MKTELRRKLKYYFYKYRLHRFVPSEPLLFLGHLSAASKWINEQKDVPFSNFPLKTYDYGARYRLYDFILEKEIKAAPIDYLEFGVANGKSFLSWVEKAKHPDSRFYGFDTFSGLPEDWGPFKKGTFSTNNAVLETNDTRCQFYEGLFQATLFDFLSSYDSNHKKVLHLDADLYTATLFVLTTLSPLLKKGDIIIFDEFNVPLHEIKAFQEWVNAFYINYTVIGESNNYFQLAVRID